MSVSLVERDDQQWVYSHVGVKVSHYRRSRGLTQKDLAEEVGLTRASIANIESGRQKIMLHTLFHIAFILDVTPLEFLPPPRTKHATTDQIDVHRLLEGRSKPEQNFVRRAVAQVERR